MNAHQSLINRLNHKKVHNVYYCFPSAETPFYGKIEHVNFWLKKVIKEYTKTTGEIENHPDYLKIQKSGNQFKIEDFKNLNKFLSMPAIESHYKFCVIGPFHALSERILNKLLKSFEEPTNNVIFFLLDDKKSSMPDTIRSRSIFFRLNKSDATDIEDLETKDLFQEMTSITFIESLEKFQTFYKENRNNEKDILRGFYSWFSDKTYLPERFYHKFTSLSKWLETSLTFNQSCSERSYFMHQFINAIQHYEKTLSS